MTGLGDHIYLPPKIQALMTGSRDLMIPGMALMGCGYDVLTGRYAYSSSCLGQLFHLTEVVDAETSNDYKQFQNDYERRVMGLAPIIPRITRSSTTTLSRGSTIRTIQTEIAGKVSISGSYGGFSGQMMATATKSRARTVQSEFFSQNAVYPHYRLEFPNDIDLCALLKDRVRDILNSGTDDDLEEFFSIYGGYYLHAGIFGGAMSYVLRTSMDKITEQSEITASIEASYKYGVGEISGTVDGSTKKKIDNVRQNSDATIETRGGADIAFSDGNNTAFSEWAASIGDHLELIDFHNSPRMPGLRPVWSLVEKGNAARTDKVQAAFMGFAERNQTVWNDPHLKPIYRWNSKSKGKKNKEDLSRWRYNHNPEKGPSKGGKWSGPAKTFAAYHEERPGTVPVYSLTKKLAKTGLYFYKLSTKKEAGYSVIDTFYAPTSPPAGLPLDNWQPIHAFKRNKNGDVNGFCYRKHRHPMKGWTEVAGVVFYAIDD